MRTKEVKELYQVILGLQDMAETEAFLRDLLTETEILEFSRRWKAARMLEDNFSYVAIEEETGLSSATIARISKWLNSGKGGYKLAIERLHSDHHHQALS